MAHVITFATAPFDLSAEDALSALLEKQGKSEPGFHEVHVDRE